MVKTLRATSRILLLACAIALIGCASSGHRVYPTTDGVATELPSTGATIVVVGNDPTSTNTCITWLQKRGLRVLESSMLAAQVDTTGAAQLSREAATSRILIAAADLGVEQVVFVESPTTNTGVSFSGQGSTTSSMSVFLGSVFGSSSSQVRGEQGSRYSMFVSTRAVAVDSGIIAWTGNARFAVQLQQVDDILVRLTCQALATAWGFRPTGTKAIGSSEMCDIEG